MEFVKAENSNIHIDSIYSILRSCGMDMYNNKGLTHWLRPYPKESIANDINNKHVFLVEDNGKFVATFSVYFEYDYLYLGKLAVLPECSGKGIGGKCLEFAENFAIENNVFTVKFDVYDKSTHAIDFYLKRGYVVTGEKPTTNFKVLLMEKHLGKEI